MWAMRPHAIYTGTLYASKIKNMENQDKRSITEKILDTFYEKLIDKEEFDNSIINKLKILGKNDKLSNEKSIEELILPKK
jgi:hypothetical protein